MKVRMRWLTLAVLGLGMTLGYLSAIGLFSSSGVQADDQTTAAGGRSLDRTTLPIPEPIIPHSTILDARNAKAPPRFEVKAPDGAPNVLIVLIDDMGFGQSSAFGGPIHMPTLERLAKGG